MKNSKFLSWFRSGYPKIKRLIDVVASAVMLVSLTPLLILISIAVALTSKGPVLFWSSRRGIKGEAFSMPKFRTMTQCSKVLSREVASESDVCFTPIGQFLRKTSLDELPQFWSVLKGDMSLIGPRPLLFHDYANEHREQHPAIFSVRPGITGLAQVNGRSFITPRNKIRYDAFYAGRMCMVLDLKIIVKTFGVILNTKMVK